MQELRSSIMVWYCGVYPLQIFLDVYIVYSYRIVHRKIICQSENQGFKPPHCNIYTTSKPSYPYHMVWYSYFSAVESSHLPFSGQGKLKFPFRDPQHASDAGKALWFSCGQALCFSCTAVQSKCLQPLTCVYYLTMLELLWFQLPKIGPHK